MVRGSPAVAVTGLPGLTTVALAVPEPAVRRAAKPMPTTSVAKTSATATTFRWVRRLAVSSEKFFMTRRARDEKARALDDPRLAGWKPKAPPRVLFRRGTSTRVRSMKDELTTILEAMRAAQAEVADYLVSADRNAELTIAKLVGILERREVVRAMRLLRVSEGPGGAPRRGELMGRL